MSEPRARDGATLPRRQHHRPDRPVPTDRLRLCVKSTHADGVDLLVNLDERDAVHTASVILAGLSALGSVKVTAENTLPEDSAGA